MSVSAGSTPTRWWDGDPNQRYWMEVVNEEEWGRRLLAPDTPTYQLMQDVVVGDVVLHWIGKNNSKRQKAGIYGVSRVAGEMQRRVGSWKGQPANVIPLANRTSLSEPYLLTDLRAKHEFEIMQVERALEAVIPTASKLYFPFHRHKSAGLKPNQRYLSKLPAEVLWAVPDLLPDNDWGGFDRPLVAPPVPGQSGVQQRYAGFCADPVLKKAIEMQAVRQAISHYEAKGYTVEDVGAYRSYDLHAVRGDEVRHVEVKGSQGYVEKILLTRNEVTHANEYSRTDLVVVSEIPWEPLPDGSIVTQDGHMDVHPDWRPSPENLKPLSYEYVLD